MWEAWVQSLDWEDPLEKVKAPTSGLWPGEFHELCSPWGRKESDTLHDFHFHFMIDLASCLKSGQPPYRGNPGGTQRTY